MLEGNQLKKGEIDLIFYQIQRPSYASTWRVKAYLQTALSSITYKSSNLAKLLTFNTCLLECIPQEYLTVVICGLRAILLWYLVLREPILLRFLTLGHCEQPADNSVFQHFVKQHVERLQQGANTVSEADTSQTLCK